MGDEIKASAPQINLDTHEIHVDAVDAAPEGKSGDTHTIRLDSLPSALAKSLRHMDKDGDGTISAA